jgi:polysaccharide export outer membrane protein
MILKSPVFSRSRVGLMLLLVSICFINGFTQQVSQVEPKTRAATDTPAGEDGRYRIGPGDVLEIKVMKAPELSVEAVRVDHQGMIRMPLIEEDIKANCLTESELAHKIADLYREYKRNPTVGVYIKEFLSQPVAVIGAVNNFQREGTQFQLRRRVRLLELLTLAGGPSEKAGLTVNVVHSSEAPPCGAAPDPAGDLGMLVSYQLRDTMKGLAGANPVLRPGDVVVVPEGDQVYVVGNVVRPSTIALKEPMTVSRAIAIAGGTAPNTKRDQVRVIRQNPGGGGKEELFVNLTAIEKKQAKDMQLMANDIVDVPISGTKSFLKSLMGAVAPAVSQMPVRVIP